MTNRCWTSPRSADGDVTHLPVLRKVSEQNEVTYRALEALLMKLRLEHAHINLSGRCRVGYQNVQMFEPEILERKRGHRRRLSPNPCVRQLRARNRPDSCNEAPARSASISDRIRVHRLYSILKVSSKIR